jgi:isopenicillin N synthase-like dioxygenase
MESTSEKQCHFRSGKKQNVGLGVFRSEQNTVLWGCSDNTKMWKKMPNITTKLLQIWSTLLVVLASVQSEESPRQTCDSAKELAIPKVDISPLTKSSEPYTSDDIKLVQSAVEQACLDYGIFELAGHGINEKVLNEAFNAHDALFALSKDVKSSIPIKSGGFTRGYVGLGKESGSDHLLECKEAFSYGMEWNPDPLKANKLQGENIWPSPDDYDSIHKQALLTWYNESIRISEIIALGIAPTLGLDLQSIRESIDGGETISIMRLFRYIAVDSTECIQGGDASRERIGSSPHTDWGFLTLILGDGGEGLQVRERERECVCSVLDVDYMDGYM